jgi:hypothetical protein
LNDTALKFCGHISPLKCGNGRIFISRCSPIFEEDHQLTSQFSPSCSSVKAIVSEMITTEENQSISKTFVSKCDIHSNYIYILGLTSQRGARGGAVVEALRYKPEGRGLESQWCVTGFFH